MVSSLRGWLFSVSSDCFKEVSYKTRKFWLLLKKARVSAYTKTSNEVKCIKNVAISELKERERERREGRRKGKKEVKNN